jgi:hypothetical protein
MVRTTGPAAAIAGIAPGIQGQGVWMGRRQLFVRFAAEAETAVLYTPEMLARHVSRVVEQSPLHSISLSGRDPLASEELIREALSQWKPPVPVMVDCDGERPDAVTLLAPHVSMIQVTVEFTNAPSSLDRALASLAAAAAAGREHAAVLAPHEGTTDGQMLWFIEQAHGTAPGTKIVVHPALGGDRTAGGGGGTVDRRYASLMERAMAIHHDVVLWLRVPSPVGGR